MDKSNYHESTQMKINLKLREFLTKLPSFTYEFFRGIENTTSSRTRLAYAYDLSVFFEYITQNIPRFQNIPLTDITLSDLNTISPTEIEYYLEFLNYYVKHDQEHVMEHKNAERGKARKLACLRSFYRYFYKKEKITNNPTLLVDMPKIHEKTITRLEIDEVAKLLDEVESGDKLTKKQQQFHDKTGIRDLAILTLLLGTGIRVSECVGLNLEDVSFELNGIKITRKGGNQVVIYFGDEVRRALLDYLVLRNKIIPETNHEKALFLSLQNKRLTTRSIQNLVKKYALLITHMKNISPHKLRSTFGTTLYQATGDIYLVADVLGHKDVNTTKKHYAQLEDERRRKAANIVKLREDD